MRMWAHAVFGVLFVAGTIAAAWVFGFFDKFDAEQFISIMLVLGIIILFVYFQLKGDNDYNFLDTLKDQNGKTSIGAHFAWAFFVLAIWAIVRKGLQDIDNVWPWVRDGLLLSLGYRAGAQLIDKVGKQPPQPIGTNVEKQIVIGDQVVPAAPAASASPLPSALTSNRVTP